MSRTERSFATLTLIAAAIPLSAFAGDGRGLAGPVPLVTMVREKKIELYAAGSSPLHTTLGFVSDAIDVDLAPNGAGGSLLVYASASTGLGAIAVGADGAPEWPAGAALGAPLKGVSAFAVVATGPNHYAAIVQHDFSGTHSASCSQIRFHASGQGTFELLEISAPWKCSGEQMAIGAGDRGQVVVATRASTGSTPEKLEFRRFGAGAVEQAIRSEYSAVIARDIIVRGGSLYLLLNDASPCVTQFDWPADGPLSQRPSVRLPVSGLSHGMTRRGTVSEVGPSGLEAASDGNVLAWWLDPNLGVSASTVDLAARKVLTTGWLDGQPFVKAERDGARVNRARAELPRRLTVTWDGTTASAWSLKPSSPDALVSEALPLAAPRPSDFDGDGVLPGADWCPRWTGDAADHGCPTGAPPAADAAPLVVIGADPKLAPVGVGLNGAAAFRDADAPAKAMVYTSSGELSVVNFVAGKVVTEPIRPDALAVYPDLVRAEGTGAEYAYLLEDQSVIVSSRRHREVVYPQAEFGGPPSNIAGGGFGGWEVEPSGWSRAGIDVATGGNYVRYAGTRAVNARRGTFEDDFVGLSDGSGAVFALTEKGHAYPVRIDTDARKTFPDTAEPCPDGVGGVATMNGRLVVGCRSGVVKVEGTGGGWWPTPATFPTGVARTPFLACGTRARGMLITADGVWSIDQNKVVARRFSEAPLQPIGCFVADDGTAVVVARGEDGAVFLR
jgi:hypothetical protein